MWFFAPVFLLLLLWAGVDMFSSCECQRWPGRISTRFRRNWGQAFPLESFGYCRGGLFIYLCCQNGEQPFAGHRSFKMVLPSQTGLRCRLGLRPAGYPLAQPFKAACVLSLAPSLRMLYPAVISFWKYLPVWFSPRLKKSCFSPLIN